MKLDYFKVFTILFSLLILSSNCLKSQENQNKFQALVNTLVGKLKGDLSEVQMKKCIPSSWQDNTAESVAKEGDAILMMFISKFDKFYEVLNSKLDKPCEFKDKVKQALKNNPPLTFIQMGEKSKLNRIKKIKSKARTSQFQPFEDIMKNHSFVINSALSDLFKSEFYTKLRVILQCQQTGPNTSPEFKDVITNFLTNVKNLQSGTEGFIETTVDACCNWVTFKEALMLLGKAKLEKDEIGKWNLYGDFFYNLIKTYSS